MTKTQGVLPECWKFPYLELNICNSGDCFCAEESIQKNWSIYGPDLFWFNMEIALLNPIGQRMHIVTNFIDQKGVCGKLGVFKK